MSGNILSTLRVGGFFALAIHNLYLVKSNSKMAEIASVQILVDKLPYLFDQYSLLAQLALSSCLGIIRLSKLPQPGQKGMGIGEVEPPLPINLTNSTLSKVKEEVDGSQSGKPNISTVPETHDSVYDGAAKWYSDRGVLPRRRR